MSQLSEKKIRAGLKQAKYMSYYSTFERYHLGAVLYSKGKIIAQGCNSRKTSPLQKELNKERGFDPDESCALNSLHAETACLLKTRYMDIDMSKAIMYIYREHQNGEKALARPCKGCMKALKDFGVKTICYTTESGYCVERIGCDE